MLKINSDLAQYIFLGRGFETLNAQEPKTCFLLSFSFQDVVWGLNSLFTVSILTRIPSFS